LHQVGDLFELNVKLRCQKVKRNINTSWLEHHSLTTTQNIRSLSWR